MEKFGPTPLSDSRWSFVAWAPGLSELSLVLCGQPAGRIAMTREGCGFYVAEANAKAGTKYLFALPDGRELPDPASRFQPDGVHGPSAVIDTSTFCWTDGDFSAPPLKETIIYELHVGTFTSEGTFNAAIPRLSELSELGITTVEVMPVAQFPGARNWGYDGVYEFAAQNSYGGPAGFQEFVNAAHDRSLSVVLDVVYNHVGPDGNYLGAFGPFFTDRYRTPWGQAINYDDAESAPVREFFIQNALYWLEEFHVDGLRLDAVHGIFDFSAHHFLAELKERVEELAARTGRRLYVMAESDLNDSRLVHRPSRGGYGLDGQWSDDFHHSVHTLLTGESSGYYADFGSIENLTTVLSEGWLYSGQYSRYRRRRHGNSPAGIAPERFVVCTQNHDQVGNRALGDRLSQIVDLESRKLAAGILLLSPFTPLLFMGEEYGETRPFQYFTSHGDPALIEAVRKGRREEFAAFGWDENVPDPQDEATFKACVLDWDVRDNEPHRTLLNLYRSLIAIRNRFGLGGGKPEVRSDGRTITLEYRDGRAPVTAIFHFGSDRREMSLPSESRPIRILVDSSRQVNTNGAMDVHASSDEFILGPRSFVAFEPLRSGEAQ
jgi:maltooligosyltrehalose trehalohydrolase